MPMEERQFEELLRRAVEPRARAGPASGAERQTILFLGNSYNPMSASCLEAIVALGHDILVGPYEPFTQGFWRLVRKRLQSGGWALILRKAAHLIRSWTRIALRNIGFPLSGFASLRELFSARQLKVIRCTDPNYAEFVHQVQSLRVDLIVVASFGRILKAALIGVPRLGCINVHPSLLPRYRGPEPFYWVLANREKTTGVTIHYIDGGIDSGDIIVQRALEIRPDETESTLMKRSARVAAELLHEAIPLLIAGRAPRIRQDHSAATYYSFPQRGASVLR